MTPPALDQTLAALADPSRRHVIEILRRGPKRAGELARATGMSDPAMSRHLRVLRRSRLVLEDRLETDARVKLYRLVPERFDELHEWLESVRGFWGDQLASFKAHVERKT